MSAPGLSRRRGAPAGASTYGDDDDRSGTSTPLGGSSSPSLARNGSSSAGGRPSSERPRGSVGQGGGGALEGRGKVAYDPRDFEDDGESKQIPKLTLLEEVLLLGLKDNQVCTF
jgi:golgi phosphoprotein 3